MDAQSVTALPALSLSYAEKLLEEVEEKKRKQAQRAAAKRKEKTEKKKAKKKAKAASAQASGPSTGVQEGKMGNGRNGKRNEKGNGEGEGSAGAGAQKESSDSSSESSCGSDVGTGLAGGGRGDEDEFEEAVMPEGPVPKKSRRRRQKKKPNRQRSAQQKREGPGRGAQVEKLKPRERAVKEGAIALHLDDERKAGNPAASHLEECQEHEWAAASFEEPKESEQAQHLARSTRALEFEVSVVRAALGGQASGSGRRKRGTECQGPFDALVAAQSAASSSSSSSSASSAGPRPVSAGEVAHHAVVAAMTADPHMKGAKAHLPLTVYPPGGVVRWNGDPSLMRYEAEHFATAAGTKGRSRSVVPRVCDTKPACKDACKVAETPGDTLDLTQRSRKTCVWCYLEHSACKQSLLDALHQKVSTGKWGVIRHRNADRASEAAETSVPEEAVRPSVSKSR